jgi:dynein heavy chain
MQTVARKSELPLDKMVLVIDITRKGRDDPSGLPKDGVFCSGLFIEGARWDPNSNQIAESKLKELTPPMPSLFIKAVTIDKKEVKNVYECPVYRTKSRGVTYVWTFNLRTKERPTKWILGGVCLLLQV